MEDKPNIGGVLIHIIMPVFEAAKSQTWRAGSFTVVTYILRLSTPPPPPPLDWVGEEGVCEGAGADGERVGRRQVQSE